MSTLLLSHDAFERHAVPEGHPERPDRMRALKRAFAAPSFDGLARREAPLGGRALAELAHPPHYVEAIERIAPQSGYAGIDADTLMSPGTIEATYRSLGGGAAAVDAVFAGEAKNAFLCARPPGHHAEQTRAMGFCFFNTAAVAARHAQRAHGAERVAIFDWDVHHGNGTQDIFWSDPTVLYASTHQMPLYPGTGARSETGEHGTIVNAPLRAGDGSAAFREAVTTAILPRIEAHAPDLIVISAGFDAHRLDPLANLELTAEDFAWATARLMEIAARRCRSRIVSILEGGYDLVGLSESAAAHVRTLQEA
jgi:acetoin utilization deacetylase AcuC-like enzyme